MTRTSMEKKKGLLDDASDYMGCQYLSDLRYLTPYQRCILAAHIETHDVKQYSLFEWNDALEYLCRRSPKTTVIAAKEALLRSLRCL